jgi:hypothetical protein
MMGVCVRGVAGLKAGLILGWCHCLDFVFCPWYQVQQVNNPISVFVLGIEYIKPVTEFLFFSLVVDFNFFVLESLIFLFVNSAGTFGIL